MKNNLLLFIMLCIMSYVANANGNGNKALRIYEDGTNFFISGLSDIMVSDLTIEGWVKLDGGVALDDFTALVDFRNSGGVASKALILRNVGGNITTSYEWNNNWTYQGAENIVATDEWQHIAVVISGADAEARFYINGVQTGSNTTYSGLGQELALGENIRVGAGLGAEPIRTLIGVIDEVRIWTVARTEEEIFDNMEMEVDPFSDGLLMYYRCNEESDAIQLTDATGNGNDLFANGTGFEFVEETEWNTKNNSVKKANESSLVNIYPNPVKDQLFIKGLDVQNSEVEIHDALGRLVERSVLASSSLNVSNLKTGLYFLNVKKGQNTYRSKFSKE